MIVLDTHVLAWADNDERRLGRKARALINRVWNQGEVAVCAMSFWEMAMLQARGRIELPATAEEWRGQLCSRPDSSNFRWMTPWGSAPPPWAGFPTTPLTDWSSQRRCIMAPHL